jgi:hypothetical protein
VKGKARFYRGTLIDFQGEEHKRHSREAFLELSPSLSGTPPAVFVELIASSDLSLR